MTIQEAIKSGKRFRRKIDPAKFWMRIEDRHFVFCDPAGLEARVAVATFTTDGIMADDWEVEEATPEPATKADLERLKLELKAMVKDIIVVKEFGRAGK